MTVKLPMTLLDTTVCITFSVWVAHAKDMAPGNPCVSMSQALITARLDRGA